MGAKVGWIGPAEELNQALPLVDWPAFGSEAEVASALAPLFEIVPMQVAAYRLARWRGITPGDFRYASEVTMEESGFPLFEAKLSRV
jgi:fructoselysine-6-P-deglycase FrlB-like protein